MEDDNENELAIVQPIVQDLLSDVIQQSSLKNLQELVDLTLEQVAEETHEKFFESLLAKCINDAVNIVEDKSKDGKLVIFPRQSFSKENRHSTYTFNTWFLIILNIGGALCSLYF